MELNEIWPLISEVISSGGEFKMTPNGISMLPLIRPSVDQVVLVAPSDVMEGDIVLYKRDNGKYVLHRVIYIKDKEYQMCGDNQRYLEYGITKEHLLAKVKEVIRDEKTIDFESKEYKRYVNKLYRRINRTKIRTFFGNIKRKIFKKKTT